MVFVVRTVWLMLNVGIIACVPKQVQPPNFSKLVKRATFHLTMKSRKGRFIQCGHVNLVASEARVKLK